MCCSNGSDIDAHVHAGATSPSSASYATDTAPLEAAPTITTANSPDVLAAVVAAELTASDDGATDTPACTCGKQLTSTTASHQNWQMCSRCKQAFYCDAVSLEAGWAHAGVRGSAWTTPARRTPSRADAGAGQKQDACTWRAVSKLLNTRGWSFTRAGIHARSGTRARSRLDVILLGTK